MRALDAVPGGRSDTVTSTTTLQQCPSTADILHQMIDGLDELA